MEHKELSFDGCGINGPNEYRDRMATFNVNHREWADKYGPLFEAAPEMLAVLKQALELFTYDDACGYCDTPWSDDGHCHNKECMRNEIRRVIAWAEGK